MKQLLAFGVTQRALAERIGVSESWLSRWLDPKPSIKVRPINVQEMDRFEAYARQFAAVLAPETKETQRDTPAATPTAGPRFHAPKRARKSG